MNKVKCFKENPFKCVYCGKIRAFNESKCECECHTKQNSDGGLSSGVGDKDNRFCNNHNDNSSFIEVIECNECNFYLK